MEGSRIACKIICIEVRKNVEIQPIFILQTETTWKIVRSANNRKIKALRYTYIEEIDVGNIVEKSVENTSAKQKIS